MAGGTLVLIVETVAEKLFHRGVALPFVRGLLRDLDIPARWLRFGLVPAPGADGAPSFAPTVEDAATLARVTAEGGFTHVLFDLEPADAWRRALQDVAPEPRVGEVGESPDVRGIRTFVGLHGQGPAGNLFDEVVPDFGWEPGNAAAADMPPMPHLLCGRPCNWRRKLSTNPAFEGVDLSGCERDEGCSFCAGASTGQAWAERPAVLMRRQLEALLRTHPPMAGRPVIRVEGEPFLRNAREFADAIVSLALPPADFLLDGRVDQVLAWRPGIERALERLAGTGHRFLLFLVGVENFSPPELERFNKGIDGHDTLRFLALMFDLEARHPDAFSFREAGDLSLILQTPWTRPADLALNLAILRQGGLDRMCTKALTSRLRLVEGMPVHALARRDGLLVDRYDDPWLDTARRTLYPDEVPWRFAEPSMEPLSRLLVRLGQEGGTRDRLADGLQSLLDEDAGGDRLLLAQCLADVAAGDGDVAAATGRPVSPDDLLRGARLLLRAAARPGAADERVPSRDLGGGVAGDSPNVLRVQAGVKPVARFDAAERVAADLLTRDTDGAGRRSRVERVPAGGGRPDPQIFVGWDPAQVREAAALTEALEAGDARPAADEAALLGRLGRLYGYPACCADSYASRSRAMRVNYRWLQLAARLDVDGPVSPLLNAGYSLAEYVPCRLTCPETLTRAERLLTFLAERDGRAAADDLVARLSHPWLVLLEHQQCALELDTDAAPRGRVPFRPGLVLGRHPLIERAATGDELVIDEHDLVVLRGGRPWLSLGARAFVWWHRAPVQAELWRLLLNLRFGVSRPDLEAPSGPRPGARPEARAPSRIETFLRARLAGGEGGTPSFAGCRVESLQSAPGEQVEVSLVGPQGALTLIVEATREGAPAYRQAGQLAVSYRSGPGPAPDLAPVDSFVAWLERELPM